MGSRILPTLVSKCNKQTPPIYMCIGVSHRKFFLSVYTYIKEKMIVVSIDLYSVYKSMVVSNKYKMTGSTNWFCTRSKQNKRRRWNQWHSLDFPVQSSISHVQQPYD